MKKWIIFVLTFIILLSATVLPASAAYYTIENPMVTSAYMINLDNGTVVCDYNSRLQSAPASITKIVTAILTIENCPDLETVIAAPGYCIRLLDGTNSSTAGILTGEEISIRELLYCLLVYSGNDAANILADYVGGGSIDAFVVKMNEFAQSLGCTDTHFANPHGLDNPEHYSTAKDIATMYSYCIKNGVFAQIAGTRRYEMPPTNLYKETRYLTTTNGLINPGIADYYYEYVQNGKTGTTDDAGRCIVSSATKDGYHYVCVALGGQMTDIDGDGVDENMAFITSKDMYKWAFNNLRIREIANVNTYVTEAQVLMGREYDYVGLVPKNSITALVPKTVTTQSVFIKPYEEITSFTVDAPVKQGDVLGKAAIMYADEVIAEVELVAAFDIQRSTPKYVLRLIQDALHSTVFKLILIAVVAIGIPLCILFLVVIPNKRRTKKNTVHVVNVNDEEQKRKQKQRKSNFRK